jgi:hypothetical protein
MTALSGCTTGAQRTKKHREVTGRGLCVPSGKPIAASGLHLTLRALLETYTFDAQHKTEQKCLFQFGFDHGFNSVNSRSDPRQKVHGELEPKQ